MQNFHELVVWRKSHELTLAVYRLSDAFPRSEQFGLTGQIRRSAASIPTNIAEGCGRNTKLDFARFLQIAMGSASELQYQLMLSKDLGYLSADAFDDLELQVQEVKRMLLALHKTVRTAAGVRSRDTPSPIDN